MIKAVIGFVSGVTASLSALLLLPQVKVTIETGALLAGSLPW